MNSTGPIPRDKFAEIVKLPYGEAKKAIRQYDPLWGVAPGEEREWLIKLSATSRVTGWVKVAATCKEDAEAAAAKLDPLDAAWEPQGDVSDTFVESVELLP